MLQGNFHPASDGFLWWKGERPAGLPSAAPVINKVAAEYGVAPVARCVDLLAGDLSLIVGTPETDPLPAAAGVTYVGPIVWQRGNATLPDWVAALSRDQPRDMGLLRQSAGTAATRQKLPSTRSWSFARPSRRWVMGRCKWC